MSLKHVKLLQDARFYIENDVEFYVCAAIDRAGWESGNFKEADEMVTAIEQSLGQFNLYTDWLRSTHGIDIIQSNSTKQYNLAWIDWMAEGWGKLC